MHNGKRFVSPAGHAARWVDIRQGGSRLGAAGGSTMAVEVAEGRAVTVRFDGSRCIHARRCVIGAPAAFRANVKGAWMEPDAAGVEELMRVALACPSGAITLERRD